MSPAGRSPKNVSASVHQRLLNEAKRSGRPFNELLQYYAMERFLYRLAQSKHGKKFLLKGALMLRAWGAPLARPTVDIDLLGRTANEIEQLVAAMREVCNQKVADDGLTFDAGSMQGERIAEEAEYEGVRLTFRANLGNARVPMQVDIGFGDVVVPGPEALEYPTILDFPAAKLQGYPRETAIAEKFHTMVKLGLLNSRMKDYYDIWTLCRQFDFSGPTLADAIRRTFENRDTEVDGSPVGLSEEFARDEAKNKQWQAFVKKLRLDIAPADLADVVAQVSAFLQPITSGLAQGTAIPSKWQAPGPWSK